MISVDESTLKALLEEDVGSGDVTSMIVEPCIIDAYIVCKEDAVIAGTEEASRIFKLVNCYVTHSIADGSEVKAYTTIMRINGDARSILAVERTVLNVMMRMSGIATYTRRLVSMVKSVNPSVMVAATRKTVPGLRILDKKAVALGGGYTHRLGLYDMVLIKDNHIALIGSAKDAVRKARSIHGSRYPIEVEVKNLQQAIEAIQEGADMIMLDNLSSSETEQIIKELISRGLRERVKVEVSGRIDESNIMEYARLNVDYISVGKITHSVRAVDMSLEVND
jgi:nicotinate-nucleotide pyrophosphorylase (carboxylating)